MATPHPLIEFRAPVLFEESAVRELCCLARRGYETKFKRETFGFLYGTISQDKRLIVRRSCYYRGGEKTRTGVVFKNWTNIRRVFLRRKELARKFRMRFLGNFHSHVEIAGDVFKGLSQEDRESFFYDPMAIIETIVFIWAGPAKLNRSATGTIVGFEPRTGYNYRIRVYAKRRSGIRHVKAKVIPSGVVVIY
ncbi:hypothetical protein HPY86_01305 [candidate division WOR-3 bacterium]|nr:hypothetical protein [candidate division WOR-3 bacterium]